MAKPKSFEEAFSKIEEIAEKLEKGDLPLKESLRAFQDGIALYDYCSNQLDNAEKEISLLVEDENGVLQEQPFDAEEDNNEQRT